MISVDLDGDGQLDLVTNGGAGVAVLLNQGNSSFASPLYFSAGRETYSIASADLNRDGRPDLVATDNATATVALLFNTFCGH